MSNIKKHELVFSSQELSFADDEDLSVLAQQGNKTAYNVLCSRYIGYHATFAKIASPNAASILDDWVLGDTFVDCLMSAIERYVNTAKASFKTFLVALYRRALAKEMSKAANQIVVVSLDAESYGNDRESVYTLSDVVSTESSAANSPTKYVDYGELKRLLAKSRSKCDPGLFEVIERMAEGCSLRKACEELDFNYNRARYQISVLKKHLLMDGVFDDDLD